MTVQPAFERELLKGLEAGLRKQNTLMREHLEILRDQRDLLTNLVKLVGDLSSKLPGLPP